MFQSTAPIRILAPRERTPRPKVPSRDPSALSAEELAIKLGLDETNPAGAVERDPAEWPDSSDFFFYHPFGRPLP
ncbi:hypothetical protein ACYOEI_08725 [Singulisphaera rosea]